MGTCSRCKSHVKESNIHTPHNNKKQGSQQQQIAKPQKITIQIEKGKNGWGKQSNKLSSIPFSAECVKDGQLFDKQWGKPSSDRVEQLQPLDATRTKS